MSFVLAALIVLCVIGAAWYLLITTEGVYLGRRVVIWLYDLYARRYDAIKKFDPEWDQTALVEPLLAALDDQGVAPARRPLVLDVATGTARLPLALLASPAFDGYVIGLDYSRRMLEVAAEKLGAAPDAARARLLYQDARRLPFDDNTFDAVTCLEALEFMPDQNTVIAELVRVARPGGVILLTNRKGRHLMPFKTQRSARLAERLVERFGLDAVRVEAWQVDYEQVWACKPGAPPPHGGAEGGPDLWTLLRCPCCREKALIPLEAGQVVCTACEARTRRARKGTYAVIEYAAIDCPGNRE